MDNSNGIEDYVHLCFCEDHPMIYRLQQEGKKIVILQIQLNVVAFKDTLFTDINAADKNHKMGPNLEELVNIQATQRRFVKREDRYFKQKQAEVLVKKWIPIKYIKNINDILY